VQDLEGCKSITNDGLLALRDLDLVYLNLNGTPPSDSTGHSRFD
jgi:hypothetical protein